MGTEPFNWREHVTLELADIGQRAAVVRALDSIAGFHEGEGAALIRAAAEQQGGRITIRDGATSRVLGDVRDIIEINPTDAGRIVNHDGARSGPETLVGILVHELYHCADDTRDVDQAAVGAFHAVTGLPPGHPAAERLLEQVEQMNARLGQNMAVTMNALLIQRTDMAAALAMEGSPEARDAATRLQSLTHEQVAQALQEHRTVGQYGREADGGFVYTSQQETDANHFTRALMEKNFGTQAVLRREYGDFTLAEQPLPPVALQQEAQPQPTMGYGAPHYDPGILGDLPSPPQVRAVAQASEGHAR